MRDDVVTLSAPKSIYELMKTIMKTTCYGFPCSCLVLVSPPFIETLDLWVWAFGLNDVRWIREKSLILYRVIWQAKGLPLRDNVSKHNRVLTMLNDRGRKYITTELSSVCLGIAVKHHNMSRLKPWDVNWHCEKILQPIIFIFCYPKTF